MVSAKIATEKARGCQMELSSVIAPLPAEALTVARQMCLGDLYVDATLSQKWRCVWGWAIAMYLTNDTGYEAGSAFAECDAKALLHDARVLLQWIRTERVNTPMVDERIDAYFRQVKAEFGVTNG
jgi:hypothetical protein